MFDIADQILYEDNHLIVLNKRPGQIVQGDKTGDVCLADAVKDFIKRRDAKPGNVFCGVIHRLDRPVSGVVVFAKTSKALSRMNSMVKERELKKTYWAMCRQQPPAENGRLENWIFRNEKANRSFVVDSDKSGAKFAVLDYRLLSRSAGGYHLLEVDLHTGRHHQIRCQLSAMGCPIRGDLKYGAQRSNPDGSISLHARRVEFVHPVSKMTVVVEAPAPFENLFCDSVI